MRGDWNVSIRRACHVFLLDRSTYHYKSRRPGQAAVEQRIREICQTRVRYGYRRVHVLLRREGWRINQKKTRRIYRELGLQLRNKTPKRRVKAKLRDDRQDATRPNETWAMDFVHDQLAIGRKIRLLTGRHILALRTGGRPALQLPRRGRRSGSRQGLRQDRLPSNIRGDPGPASHALDLWAYTRGVALASSRPRKPTDNAFIEAFNGRFRAECLNAPWFM